MWIVSEQEIAQNILYVISKYTDIHGINFTFNNGTMTVVQSFLIRYNRNNY